jgi:hypothetical protein
MDSNCKVLAGLTLTIQHELAQPCTFKGTQQLDTFSH